MQIYSSLPVKNNFNIKKINNQNTVIKQNQSNKFDVGSLEILSKYNLGVISFGAKNYELFEEMNKHVTNSEKDRAKRKELFLQTTQTVQDNINGIVEKFKDEGLTVEKYLPVCIKQPQLFYQSPDTIENNVRGLTKKFKDEGLTVEKYLPACIKQPSLFYQSPDTIENNVRGLTEKFKDDGLTVDKYLSACIKQPSLFCLSPDTIENNVRGLTEKFKDDGLTVEKYLPACIKQPQLFYQSPDTIENNVRGLTEKFKDEGLTVEKYLPACIKQPQLFCQSPDTIGKHIDILRFIKKDNDFHNNISLSDKDIIESVVQHSNLTYSNNRYYTFFLRDKMFGKHEPDELKSNKKLNERMKDYLKNNPDKKYGFSIINDKIAPGFIEFTKQLSLEASGKDDMFEISVINQY